MWQGVIVNGHTWHLVCLCLGRGCRGDQDWGMVSDRLGDPGWPATAGAGDASTAAGAAAVSAAAPAAAASTTAVVPLVLDRGRQGCSGGEGGRSQGKGGRRGKRNSLKQTCLLAKKGSAVQINFLSSGKMPQTSSHFSVSNLHEWPAASTKIKD